MRTPPRPGCLEIALRVPLLRNRRNSSDSYRGHGASALLRVHVRHVLHRPNQAEQGMRQLERLSFGIQLKGEFSAGRLGTIVIRAPTDPTNKDDYTAQHTSLDQWLQAYVRSSLVVRSDCRTR